MKGSRTYLARYFRVAGSVLLLLCGMLTSVSAQSHADYPNRPIKMVVPYPPGGGGDIVGRLIAREIEKALNATVIIDNKPGAAGNIGAGVVARSDPDGYTILLCTNGILAANPSLYRSVPFNTLQDFSFISEVANAAIVLVVNPSLQVKTLPEYVALAKKKPDSVTYGSGGVGTGNHLAAQLFMADAGIKLFHVPYKGTPPAHLDLLAGRINSMFDQVAASTEDIRAGKLRALAVTSAVREATLPDVPSVAEFGYRRSEASTWYGLVAPAGTPDDIVAKLSKAVVDATKQPDVREAFRKVGLEALGSDPQATKQYIQSEIVKWRAIIKEANIQPN